MRNALLLSSALGLAAVACGEDAAINDIEFEAPQIVPQSNVLCLSYDEVEANTRTAHFVQLTNRGRESLVIERAEVEDDARGSFEVGTIREVGGGADCSPESPCRLASNEDAVLQFFYAPNQPGWDTANLRVYSNAQNFPRLRLFVLGRARPSGAPNDGSYDPGPKPATAVDADGNESCPEP